MGGTMLGEQTKALFCNDPATGLTYNPTNCQHMPKPEVATVSCNEHACTDYNWMTTPWTGCVVVATGTTKGTRTRTRHCHAGDGSQALNSECPQDRSPHLVEDCDITKCPAPRPTPANQAPNEDPEASTANPVQVSLYVVLCLMVMMLL